MRAGWVVAIAAGMAIGAAPLEVAAQGNSNRARQQQEMQRQRQQAREAARREADRRERAAQQARERRQKANRSGMVLRRNDERARRDRDRDRRNDRYNDPWTIFGRNRGKARRHVGHVERGPAFCRSGEGHPVHGRRWCRDKGFGLGRERSRDIWGDIVYRDRRYDNRRMNRSTLENILGSVVLGRFDTYGRSYYGNQSLNGRWLDNRASVLQLYMGSVPIARLIDTNRDGRVDNVSLLR